MLSDKNHLEGFSVVCLSREKCSCLIHVNSLWNRNMPHPANSDIVLQLDESNPFATGGHRDCYVHPEDPDKCIKIVARGDHKEALRECAYYKHLENRNISWCMLSRYYGEVRTNLGPGFVFELTRDYTGEVSKPMHCYHPSAGDQGDDVEGLSQSIAELKSYTIDQKIVTMTLKTKNILYQRISPTEGKLVIVDGVGNSDYIPICNYVDFMAVMKIKRRWRRFEASLPLQETSKRSSTSS
jgi:hypothetical protein